MVPGDSSFGPDSVFELRVLEQLREQTSFTMALAKRLGTSHQRVSRVLRRLEGRGLVRGQAEAGNPQDLQRPLRTYYRLTPHGEQALRAGARWLSKEEAP